MQYLVHTCGEVTQTQSKAYVVDAKSEEEAQRKAQENFSNDYDVVSNRVVYSQMYDRTKNIYIACILMFIAVALSFHKFDGVPTFWNNLFHTNPGKISIAPNIPSCLCAIGFYASYIIRFKGIDKVVSSWINAVLCVFSVLLIASFFQMILTADKLKFLGIIPLDFLDPMVLIVCGIILSWIGVKLVSVVLFGLVAVMGVSNIIQISDAMKGWGVVYIMCAFIGILLWLSAEPCMIEAIPKFKNDLAKGYLRAKSDCLDASQDIQKIVSDNSIIDKTESI